jgi:hypothetical protein
MGGPTYGRRNALPFYADRLTIQSGVNKAKTFRAVIAATSTGFVYAIDYLSKAVVPAGEAKPEKDSTTPMFC